MIIVDYALLAKQRRLVAAVIGIDDRLTGLLELLDAIENERPFVEGHDADPFEEETVFPWGDSECCDDEPVTDEERSNGPGIERVEYRDPNSGEVSWSYRKKGGE